MKKGTLKTNIAAMGLIQISNYLIPLITIPYLISTLKIQQFGQMAFFQAIISYFVLFVEYGFVWSATKSISIHGHSNAHISEVFVTTFFAQCALLIIGFITLLFIVIFFPILVGGTYLVLILYLQVLGVVLYPDWYFQGMQLMKFSSIIQLTSKVLVLSMLFIFVKSPADFSVALTIISVPMCFAGIIAFYLIYSQKLISWTHPKLNLVIESIKSGFPYFLSKLNLGAYTITIPIVLGIFSGYASVGAYNIADKLRAAAISLLNPISMAVFPRMANLYANSPSEARNLLIKSLMAVAGISFAGSFILFFFASQLVILISGQLFNEAILILKWMSFVPFVNGISNVIAVQVLMANGRNFSLNMIRGSLTLLGLIFLLPIIFYNGSVGAAQAMLIVESIIMLIMLLCAAKWRFL